MGARVAYLDDLRRSKNIFTEYYDPDGERYGLPTYPYHWAPNGLLTIRQLKARGLRPGGQPIAAQILWRHRRQRRVAYLYRQDRSKPRRQPTAAQLIAIGKALQARRTCPTCGSQKPYCIPTSVGECNDCAATWRT